MPKFQCLPSGITIDVPDGITILEACHLAGVMIAAACGGKGICGKCRVRIVKGEVRSPPGEERTLSAAERRAGWRLACTTYLAGDLVIEVDKKAQSKEVILVDFKGREAEPDHCLRAMSLALPPPSLADQASDFERLARSIGSESLTADQRLLRELPQRLRRENFRVTAILDGHDLLDVCPAEGKRALGLAVDLGTTTIAGALCEMASGDVLAVASRTNPQVRYGDDVITRIDHSRRGLEAREELQRVAAKAVAEIMAETCAISRQRSADIYAIQVASNPTMQHLLLCWDASAIAETPFILTMRRGAVVSASAIGLEAGAAAKLRTMPHISAYVGGDIVAGLLAHRIHEDSRAILFLDVGTNGEIVLRAGGITYACATAAGPAFEGARISCGMRAATGAIAAVRYSEGDVRITTVDDVPPQGICGTGLLDAVAVLLDLDLLDETGHIRRPDECPAHAPPLVRARLANSEGGAAFRLAAATSHNPEIMLTQQDIREFQLAKGAIAAGCQILLQHAGLTPSDIDKVILAGAFGNYLRPASAQRTGLLPPEIPLARIAAVGNAALAGSRLCLLSAALRGEAERIAQETRYVELSGRPEFQAAFAEAMLMPMGV